MNKVLFLLFTLVATSQSLSATEDEAFGWYSELNQKPGTVQTLNETQRDRLFRNARYHKVAALEMLSHYDPTEIIGFCFGRAMTVHLLAQKMGLNSSSIRKLFVIGDLRSGDAPEWRFHVTTLVKGEDQKWWAVDPIMEPPVSWGSSLKMEEWMETVQRTWDKQRKAHFYLVDNSTVLPDIREVPEMSQETGTKVIEVSFDPSKLPGKFKKQVIGGRVYYEASLAAQHEYFINAYESEKDERFQYLGISINGIHYDYKNYFVDLLTDLKSEVLHTKNNFRVSPVSFVRVKKSHRPSLFSTRVEAWTR